MADETPGTSGVAAKVEPPVFDPAAIEKMVQGAVRTSIEAMAKEGQTRQAEADAAKAQADQAGQAGKAAATNPFAEMIQPVLEPTMKTVRDLETRTALAADAVTFYTDPANATAHKYRAQIEKIVTEQQKRGNLVARTDAWKYLRGGDLYDELGKESLTAHEQKIKEAQAASAAGPSTTVPKFSKPIDDMNTDELGTALKGVAF